MGERFKFFRSSFYYGTSSIIIFFDFNKPTTIYPFIRDSLNELYNYIGPVPIFLISLNHKDSSNDEYIQEFSKEDNVFYFQFQNTEKFQREILRFIARISLQMIQDSPDIIATKIRKKIEKYVVLKKQGIDHFYNVIKEWDLKIVDNTIKILNKYGLFTIDLNDGNVIYESLICENCQKNESCRKKSNIPKKALCIVADSLGWNNSYIEKDKLLLLSKIYAILHEKLPEHVINQMHEIQKCFEFVPLTPIESMFLEKTESEKSEIYIDLKPYEIKNRLRILKSQLYEGRIPPSTYFKMVKILKQQIHEFNESSSEVAVSMSRQKMLRELENLKQITNNIFETYNTSS